MGEKRARPLVLDTSVALKFYRPEEGHEEAVGLLEASEAGAADLLAPGTILPEGYNAIAQQRRRGLLDEEDAAGAWEKLLAAPVYAYATETGSSSTTRCSWPSPRTRRRSWSPPTASCSKSSKVRGTLTWQDRWDR